MQDLQGEFAAEGRDPIGGEAANGAVAKALSFLRHFLKPERRPWAIVTGATFGVALTLGHVVGGVTGLYEGYERIRGAWFDKETASETIRVPPPEQHLNPYGHALSLELRSEFIRARNKLDSGAIAEFSRAEEVLSSLHRVDESIAQIWYFEGEIKRIKNSRLFTSKSCPKPLSAGGEIPDYYHQDFYRYLELARSVSEANTAADFGSEVCYQRLNGVCFQRTAWIHHLLGNDLYQEALATIDGPERNQKLKRAAVHVHQALTYRDPDGVEGFDQCTSKIALDQQIEILLEQKR